MWKKGIGSIRKSTNLFRIHWITPFFCPFPSSGRGALRCFPRSVAVCYWSLQHSEENKMLVQEVSILFHDAFFFHFAKEKRHKQTNGLVLVVVGKYSSEQSDLYRRSTPPGHPASPSWSVAHTVTHNTKFPWGMCQSTQAHMREHPTRPLPLSSPMNPEACSEPYSAGAPSGLSSSRHLPGSPSPLPKHILQASPLSDPTMSSLPPLQRIGMPLLSRFMGLFCLPAIPPLELISPWWHHRHFLMFVTIPTMSWANEFPSARQNDKLLLGFHNEY